MPAHAHGSCASAHGWTFCHAGCELKSSHTPHSEEVRYEELHSDLRGEVRRIAHLLGMGDADDGLVDAVVAASSFDAMKRQANNASHLREGKAGGGGAAFGRSLTEEFDATFRERAAKCGIKL